MKEHFCPQKPSAYSPVLLCKHSNLIMKVTFPAERLIRETVSCVRICSEKALPKGKQLCD